MIMRYITEHGSEHLIDFDNNRMSRTAGPGRNYITNDSLWQQFHEIRRIPLGAEPVTWDDLLAVMNPEDIAVGDKLYYVFTDGGWQLSTRVESCEPIHS